ncbi:MAG: PIN domain-containing protein [Acidimicrobiaceae bacterium]|nr:PIN domain-containing protein [Acidimicrobiaceae bacterium]
MILPDVNILVYAYKREEADHLRCADWLNGVVAGSETLALVDVVLTGFLRVVTNRRIYADPAPLHDSLAFVDRLRSARPARTVHATNAAWDKFAAFAENDRMLRGNLVPDAWLASVAVSVGARLATADAGFARFGGLEWFNPTVE